MPATLDPNLQLYFPMNTAPNAQQMIANSAAANSQIPSATTPATGVALVNDSTFGQCLQFDGGVNSYITLPSMNIDFSKGLTIEAWVCYSNFNGLSKIIDLGMNQGGNTTGNSNRIALGITNEPVLSFGIQTSNWAFANADQPADNLQTGRWYHVTGTVDQNGNGSVYINGILKNANKTMPVPVNIARDHCFIGKTNDGSAVFQGKMACLRLYNRALASNEILNDMQGDLLTYVTSNSAPAAPFTASHPVAFNVYDQQGHAVLYIVADDTEDASTVLTVDLLNVSTTSISLVASTSASAASDTNYHFQLNFPMGVLSTNSLNKYQTAQVLASNWSVFSKSNTASRQDSLYLLYTTGMTLAPAARLTLDLNLSAAASAGARGAQVEMSPNPAQVTFTDKTPVLGGQIATVQIISHQGVRNIPLQVGFVGTNQVLNDGATANSLVLEIINTLDASDLGNGVIALDPANTKLVIQFDSSPDAANPGDQAYVPWALGTLSQVKTIAIAADASTPNWTINQTIDGQQQQWEITPSGITKLNPGDTIKLNLSNIVSSIRSGLTNLILNYEGIPGYWDGQFVCPISKSPLFFFDPPSVQPIDLLLSCAIEPEDSTIKNIAPNSPIQLSVQSGVTVVSDAVFGNCVNFDGSGQAYILIGNDPTLSSTARNTDNALAFATWLKLDTPTATDLMPIFYLQNDFKSILLGFDPQSKGIKLLLGNYDSLTVNPDGIDSWMHIAFCIESNKLAFYLNGICVNNVDLTTIDPDLLNYNWFTGSQTDNSNYIGSYIGYGQYINNEGGGVGFAGTIQSFKAKVGSLQVFNRALSSDEISILYLLGQLNITDIGSNLTSVAVGINTLKPWASLEINGSLKVDKSALFLDVVGFNSKLAANGEVALNGNVTIQNDKSLTVGGTAVFNNSITANSGLTVGGTAVFNNNITANADITINNGKTLTIGGMTTFEDNATIQSGKQLRIEAGSGTVFSMGGSGDFQIDAPGTLGGRFIVTTGSDDKVRVGIGINEPTATLHVDGDSFINGNIGVLTSSPLAPLHVSGDSYLMGKVGVNITSPSAQLHVSGDSYLIGNVGIGTTSPVAPLHVGTQSLDKAIAGYFKDEEGHDGPLPVGGSWPVSIYAIDSIVSRSRLIASQTDLASDARTKLIFESSDATQDLALLQKLSVTNYQWIDPLINGDIPQKKLIAQDVEKIYPQAVNLLPLPTAIPNVYQSAVAFWHDPDNRQLTVTTGKPHEFEPGDRIDLYTDQEDMKNISVQAVLSDRQFVVDCDKAPEKVFVYGKYVTDFRTIDYDAIAMLNVSATQELARRVEMLEARLAAFEKGLVA